MIGYNPVTAWALPRLMAGMGGTGPGMGMGAGNDPASRVATPPFVDPGMYPVPGQGDPGQGPGMPPAAAPGPPMSAATSTASYQGAPVPDDIDREAMRRAQLAMGLGILEAAPTGNLAAIPHAYGASQGVRDSYISEALERERQMAKDDLDLRKGEEQIVSSQEARVRAGETHGWNRAKQARMEELWGREDETRAGSLQAAQALAAEVQELLPDSPEADRAEALLALGPEGFEALQSLHESATKRSRLDSDFEADTRRGIERDRDRIDAGVETEPGAWLELQREFAQARRGRSAGGDDKPLVTPGQYADDLRTQTTREYQILKDQHEAQYEAELARWESVLDSLPLGEMPEGDPPTPPDYASLYSQAEEAAEQRIRRAYRAGEEMGRGQGASAQEGQGTRGEDRPSPAQVDAALDTVQSTARRQGVELTAEDLALIRQDLANGFTAEDVLRQLLGGGGE